MVKLIGSVLAVGALAAAALVIPQDAEASPNISGTVTGSGEILSETFLASGNVAFFEIVESQSWAGDMVGTRAQAVPEGASFNLNTGLGVYAALHEFSGTVDGTSCNLMIVEAGTANLGTGAFSGEWETLYSDCDLEVSGQFSATATFTSATEYTISGSYTGKID